MWYILEISVKYDKSKAQYIMNFISITFAQYCMLFKIVKGFTVVNGIISSLSILLVPQGA